MVTAEPITMPGYQGEPFTVPATTLTTTVTATATRTAAWAEVTSDDTADRDGDEKIHGYARAGIPDRSYLGRIAFAAAIRAVIATSAAARGRAWRVIRCRSTATSQRWCQQRIKRVQRAA